MIRSPIRAELAGIASVLLLMHSSAAAQLVPAPLVPTKSILVEPSVAEIRVSAQWITLLHRKSGSSWPLPGEDWVAVLDAQGLQAVRIVPSEAVPDARMVNVHHAEARDAALFVSVATANDRNQFASVILRYDLPGGKLARVIRTNPIECMHITSDTTSIWCLGANAEHSERSSRDYDLLYRFSHDGILQNSALNWSRDLPRSSRPWGYGPSGPSALVPTPGGVRVWLPNAGRVTTWLSHQKLEIKEIPAALVSSEAQDVVDTGRTVIVSSFQQPSSDRFDRARKISVWDGDATVTEPVAPIVPVGKRIVGRIGSQLLIWDRDGQRLDWVPVGWIQ